MTQVPDSAILAFIERTGLVDDGEMPRFRALTGGVSSDIWLVETGKRTFCVKRARREPNGSESTDVTGAAA